MSAGAAAGVREGDGARDAGLPRLRRADLAALLLYAVAAVLVTWPLAASPGRAVSVRGDYFINVWNAWWMDTAVLERGESPWWTDALHHPRGLSLAKHTLSPLNSLAVGALSRVVGVHDSFKAVLLVHVALGGWFMYLLAVRLTGSRAGALVAGTLFAATPYRTCYVAQMNVGTLEFLPLALFFMVGAWRTGRAGQALGVALAAALVAATSLYYLVFAALLGGLVLLGGRTLDRSVPWSVGARRLLAAGAAAALAVVLVAWPTVAGMTGLDGGAPGAALEEPEADAGGFDPVSDRRELRSNDLLGFSWVGPPERLVVSWPTMLGWTTVLVLLLGAGVFRERAAWAVAALLFFVLGLGPELQVGGEPTGVPLPGAWLADLPVLAMLRKPDRFYVLVALFVALLAAGAWRLVLARLTDARHRAGATAVVVVLLAAELSPAPLSTFEVDVSPRLATLRDTGARSVVDLPQDAGRPRDARWNLGQTVHGLPMPGGYVTNLAVDPERKAVARAWRDADALLGRGRADALVRLVESEDVDLVVLHTTEAVKREAGPLDGRTIWAPFALADAAVAEMRQRGHIEARPFARGVLAARRRALEAAFGAPIAEDDRVVVFDAR